MWAPDSIIQEEWGRLQVIVGGVDVTFFRDVPTQIKSCDFTEPFGDATASLVFPQITPFEDIPVWLNDWPNVEIYRVHPDGVTTTLLWEGLVPSLELDTDEAGFGIIVECLGALYQADLFKAPPSFDLDARDVGHTFARLFNERSANYGLRLGTMAEVTTGIYALNRGAWQPLLTGYIQDLLTHAVTDTSLAEGKAFGIALYGDNGYWVAGSRGMVIPFYEAPYRGSRAGLPLNEPVTGMAGVPSGDGYWLVAEDGGVFAFGMPFFGSPVPLAPLPGKATQIEARPTGDGYWVLLDTGHVYAYGAAGYFGGAEGDLPPGAVAVDIAAAGDGAGYWILSDVGGVYAYGSATFDDVGAGTGWVAVAGVEGSNTEHYLLNADGNVEAMGGATHHGDMGGFTLNAPMADMDASDIGYVLVGEDGGAFAYGGVEYRGSVVDGGGRAEQYTIVKGINRIPVLQLKQQLTEYQWTITIGTPGITARLKRDMSMAPNAIYGEGSSPDGCNWRNTKYPTAADLDTAFYLPIAQVPEVEPFKYDPGTWAVEGPNPQHDPHKVRVEHYVNMGDAVTKYEGAQSAAGEMWRNIEPGWMGTLILHSDPEEGHRFDMKYGDNILIKSFQGGRVFHISKVSMDFDAMSVALEIDEKSRDLVSMASIRDRDREITDPARRPKSPRRNSRITEDRVLVFDCEAGAGAFDTGGTISGDEWHVFRVPFAERGNIVRTLITASEPIEFAVAVFNREWTSASLTARVPDGPFSFDDDGLNPWDTFTDEEGLVIAWGGIDQPAGYSPQSVDDADAEPTGVYQDDAPWYYHSTAPPWLWVAIWHEASDELPSFTGAFTPGTLAVT